jgi:hypothetical protein
VVSDKPLTEDEWIKARGADVIDGEAVEVPPEVSPTLPKPRD